jgi:hypothetical protein
MDGARKAGTLAASVRIGLVVAAAVTPFAAFGMMGTAAAQSAPIAAAKRPAQTTFTSADDAVAALVAALQKRDHVATADILGPGSEALLNSGDPTKDDQERRQFLDAYTAHHALSPNGPDHMMLQVGADNWPMPIPLVLTDGKWRFDSRTGAQAIVDRRIGRNEIEAIRFCLAYVDAQKAYFDLFKQATGVGVYARLLVSTTGNYDGLYWPSAAGVPESPLTPLVQSAIAEGYPDQLESGKLVPYEGYYYRILTTQGANAPGGNKSYLQDGKLTGGFALVAWPVAYRASGVMTFIVDQDGIVFQNDLGPNTAARAKAMTAFDPGLDWTLVDISAP